MTTGMSKPTPLRVLWVIKGLGPGGAERLLVTLAKVGDPAEVHYTAAYVVAQKSQLVAELEAAGVAALLLGKSGRSLSWPTRLRAVIARGDYDVVHTHSPVMAVAVRLIVRTLSRSRRPSTVYTEHNDWHAYRSLTRIANRLTYGSDDHTFAVSRAVRDSVQPLRRRRGTEVLVHGIDRLQLSSTRPRQEVRAELGCGDSDLMVITVANMRPEKAYPDLLIAAQRALQSTTNVHFFSVGQGPLEAATRAEVHRLGIADRFHVLGGRDDVFDLLGAADVFILASHWEGFPIAVMEAMSMGLPCVATRVGGVPDAITHGIEGLLAPPGEPFLLAQALLEMITDETRRDEMAQRARLRSEAFDIRDTNRRLLDTYDGLRDGHRRARTWARADRGQG